MIYGDNDVSVQPYAHPQQIGAQTPHMYIMDMGCSLKGSTASTIA
jgi:hypothetical protein